jgi:hypothetical protein
MRRAPRRSPVAAAALTLGGLVLAGPASAGAATAPPVNSVVPFGTTAVGANAVSNPNAPIVGMAATPDGGGY